MGSVCHCCLPTAAPSSFCIVFISQPGSSPVSCKLSGENEMALDLIDQYSKHAEKTFKKIFFLLVIND